MGRTEGQGILDELQQQLAHTGRVSFHTGQVGRDLHLRAAAADLGSDPSQHILHHC
ncbi:hypothetical protein ACFSC4_24080 [Deinococcus malanensis]|uniref:hypothetical protein n=1 Tax=Deinococcus malanensis TaxID=1706855 RepID=UPI00363B0914